MIKQELIKKLQSLKQVKPRENWVLFNKNQILSASHQEYTTAKTDYVRSLGNMFEIVFRGKLAYSFSLAVILFIAIGTYALVSMQKANSNSNVALLAAEAELRSNFTIMAEKSKNLAKVIESEPQKVDKAIEETKIAVEKVTESIKKDPSLAKTVASETMKNRTYLNIIGRDDLAEANDTLYSTTLDTLFNYYEDVTMPQEQHEALELIKDSYKKGEITAVVGVEFVLKVLNNIGE